MISFFSQARQALGFQLDLNKTEQTFVQSPALLGGAGVFCGGGGFRGAAENLCSSSPSLCQHKALISLCPLLWGIFSH